jgi:hypothetical protein
MALLIIINATAGFFPSKLYIQCTLNYCRTVIGYWKVFFHNRNSQSYYELLNNFRYKINFTSMWINYSAILFNFCSIIMRYHEVVLWWPFLGVCVFKPAIICLLLVRFNLLLQPLSRWSRISKTPPRKTEQLYM